MGKFGGAQASKAKFADKKPLPPPVSDNDQMPIFSFEYMQDRSGYSVNCCNADDRAQLASKLYRMSQMTWVQIMQAGRHGAGTEKIGRDQIAAPIPNAVTEDTSLLALRFNGKKPMVGYRDGRTFHVLWLDRNFTLYPHGS